jgi:hypothetical protein
MAKRTGKRPPDDPPERAAETDEPTGKRLGIQLGADGKIEWDRLRLSTREELRTMLADPRIASELGAAPLAAESGGGGDLDAATIGMLYGALGALMMGAAKMAGYPDDQASTLQFTADERAALLDPTNRVLSKYTGALGAWQDEIMLAFALGSIVTAKVTSLKKPAKVIKIAERGNPPASEPEPENM